VPNFEFMLGYSGYMKVFEDTLYSSGRTTTKTGPLFSGFDLRVRYRGIQSILMYTHNNISFGKTDTSTADAVAVGVWGQNLAIDNAQNWLAAYNGLGFNYVLNNQITFTFLIQNRLGIVTTTVSPSDGSEAYSIKRINNRLGGGGLVIYQFNSNLALQSGIALQYVTDSYTNTRSGAQEVRETRNASGGTFVVTVPVFMSLNIR